MVRRTDFDDVTDAQDKLLGRLHDVLVEAVLDTVKGNIDLLRKHQCTESHIRSVTVSALSHLIGDVARNMIDASDPSEAAQLLFRVEGMIRAAAQIKHSGVLH